MRIILQGTFSAFLDTLKQGYSIGGPRAKSGPGVIFTGPLSIMLKSNPFFFFFFVP